MGKEHGGEESYDGDEDGEEKRECTLSLNGREGHEAGEEGESHGVLLCVDFSGADCVFDVRFSR